MNTNLPHICFLAPNAFPLLANSVDIQIVGGAELQQVIIAKGLVQRGYRVSMICLDFGQDDRCEIDGVTVHRAFRPGEGLPVLRFIWPRLTSIWRCLKDVDADIFYQRAAGVLTGVMAAYCQHSGRKSIFSVAGEPMIPFKRDQWIYEYGIKRVDRIVVQNAAQQRFVRKEIGRESILIPSSYQPAHPRNPITRLNVLWVSTIRHWKRPELFLDVASSLPHCQFTMIGGVGVGERPFYDTIRLRAEKLENVDFVGFVPYAEIDRYFDSAALFVNTSDNTEGFPNTFLQSWARGIPTVSFFDSGARMNEQPVGRLVRSVDEMTEAIADLLENEVHRSRLGEECKRYVETNHSPGRILDLYEDVFRAVMANKCARVSDEVGGANAHSE